MACEVAWALARVRCSLRSFLAQAGGLLADDDEPVFSFAAGASAVLPPVARNAPSRPDCALSLNPAVIFAPAVRTALPTAPAPARATPASPAPTPAAPVAPDVAWAIW